MPINNVINILILHTLEIEKGDLIQHKRPIDRQNKQYLQMVNWTTR